jgi:RNA polymerase sigma-70 factor (ECF subfamily)
MRVSGVEAVRRSARVVVSENIPAMPRIEGFDAFYASEYPRAVAVAHALLGGGLVAEDVVQETFLATYRQWDRVSRYENPRAWVRRVLVNRATSSLRRRSAEWRAVTRLSGRVDPGWVSAIEPESGEVWKAVAQLPKRQAQSVALYYVDQLSLDEIGEVLGCSAGTVKTHLSRARTRLGRKLNEFNEVTG